MVNELHLQAIEHVKHYALEKKESAVRSIREVAAMSDIAHETLDNLLAKIKENAKVALHFHPDRITPAGTTVAKSLLATGEYKNQFETGWSNGLLSPNIGGDRDVWENMMFGNVYSDPAIAVSYRPKYGAFFLLHCSDGPSPRFGSCYFILKQEVSRYCTFSFGDSYRKPHQRGTLDVLDDLIAALLVESFERSSAFGQGGLRPSKLINKIENSIRQPFDPSSCDLGRNLDHYIEAQIHSSLRLQTDFESLIADPSFIGTEIEPVLNEIARAYNIKLDWHKGFSLDVNSVPSDFRGPSMPSLAKRVAVDNVVNAYSIGLAAKNVFNYPESFADIGSQREVWQQLKLLWHVVVRFGRPAAEAWL